MGLVRLPQRPKAAWFVMPIPYGYCHCGCGERTRIATSSDKSSGRVKDEPVKYKRGHNKRRTPNDYEVRDCGYETPCWVWLRNINEKGYGKIGWKTRAHRAYYERFVGPIPEGMMLDHLCRIRACVNPDHLEPVTNGENVRRGLRHRTDLNDGRPPLAQAIRRARIDMELTQREFARLIGCPIGSLGHWELGSSRPLPQYVPAMQRLGIEVD
jgi:DNA-binding XRE family transcriptional regulator